LLLLLLIGHDSISVLRRKEPKKMEE